MVGLAVRAFLAIPHAVVLMILGIGMNAWMLLGWIPIQTLHLRFRRAFLDACM
jgi:hypothetical protein